MTVDARLTPFDERTLAYAASHTTQPPEYLSRVAEETSRMEGAQMLSGHVAGGLLAALVHATQARLVLELGTFSGYSALSMAMALPPGGRIITCELDPERAEIARRHFDASPHGDRIEIRVGPALESAKAVEGPFGVVFIDAHKPEYVDYYEAVVPKLAPNGVIVVDNTLWSGAVADESDTSETTEAIRRFNEHVLADPRTQCVILPVGDGMTLAWPI
jgi:caffeoyl-CoA O-methyltransferase